MALAVAGFSVALWVGAWWMQNWTPPEGLPRLVVRSEAFHIAAHLALYATLYALCRRLLPRSSKLGVAPAVALTLCVAVAQEMVQVRTYRGTFLGRGEWFDLAVDAIAIAAVEWRSRRRERAREAP
jgi:hypothetical protein